MKKQKFNAKKTIIDGITFDSKREAKHYLVIRDMLKKGEIMNFERQVEIELQPSFTTIVNGKKSKVRPIRYVADFVLYYPGRTEIVEVKGFSTQAFKMKWKMLQYKYRGLEKEYQFKIVK